MRFEAAIFDLDGTLLDSTGVWDGILAHCLSERGLGCPEDYVAEVCSRSFAEAADYTIARFGLDERPERLIEEWNALSLDEYANRVRLLPGALDYLQRLSAQGVRLAVATSLPERLYRPCLERLGIAGMFGALCSTDETGKGKAEPDLFLLAAGRLGVDIGSCAVFDDTLDAVRAARSAGMLAVAVLSPCSPPGIEDEADVCVRSWTGETGEGEHWELYDENRRGTGLMMRRGDPVPAGLYHICASGWLMDSRGPRAADAAHGGQELPAGLGVHRRLRAFRRGQPERHPARAARGAGAGARRRGRAAHTQRAQGGRLLRRLALPRAGADAAAAAAARGGLRCQMGHSR